ncbi:uncharacterized protein METZ01_LOCUS151186, partial [marine metagenome]
MLEGFVAFPKEFARRYREKGYWEDRTLADVFTELCHKYGERIAVCDAETEVSYRELDSRAENLALNLLDAGLNPGDIVVLQLGNVLEFVYTYFAFHKIGVRPILALHTHRYRELKQFVELSGAVASFTVDRAKDCDFTEIVSRIRSETSSLKLMFVLGKTSEGFQSLAELIARPSQRDPAEIQAIQKKIDPEQPALFLLSGGTTGIPKLIPRSHNDYVCNSKLAGGCTGITEDSVLLDVLPIGHNLPLACPGLQGFMLKGAKVVLHTSTRAEQVFGLVQTYGVTHIHVVPALLIMWMNDEAVGNYDLSSIR